MRPLAAFITATVAGILVNFVPEHKKKEAAPEPACFCCSGETDGAHNCNHKHSLLQRMRSGLAFAFGGLLADMGPSLLFGILIAGMISALVPPDFIEQNLGSGIRPMLVMLLVGIPLYVCATASTPIVAALALKGLSPDIVFTGKQAVDDDASQVGERVAELLDLPHASVITRFELSGATATVDREVEGGHYTLEIPLPAVFTAQKALNTPRYPTLPNIMKAKKKEIKEVSLSALGVSSGDAASELVVESLSLPRQKRLGKVLEGEPLQQVQELVKILREQEKVL